MGSESYIYGYGDLSIPRTTKPQGHKRVKKRKEKKTARCKTISQINFAFLRFLFVITIIISLKNADVLRR